MVFSAVPPSTPTRTKKLDGASLAALLDAAQADSSLCSLRLSFAGLTPNLVVQLADFLEANRSVIALDLTGNAIGSHGASCIAASLQRNTVLQQLTLAGCALTSDAVAPFVAWFTGRAHASLRSIDFSNNQIDDDAAAALAAMVTTMSESESAADEKALSLDLRKNWLGDAAMSALAKAMQTNHRLLTLRVEGNQDENATIAKKQIAFYCQRNRTQRERRLLLHQIQSLGNPTFPWIFDCHLQHVELTLSDAQLLSDALRDNRSLVSLRLRDNALPVEATRRILQSLETHPSLWELQIQDNELGDVGFAALNTLLRRSSSLVRVAVVRSTHAMPPSITSQLTLGSLYHTLARDTLPLRHLVLANCGLGDMEIGVIVSGISLAGRLMSLELRNNQFTDRSVHVLARVLHRCRRLHTLDVSGNLLTLDGALVLAHATARHAAMQTLLLGRFPQYDTARIQSIIHCLEQSETLVRVDLTTKQRASCCTDDLRLLHSAWRARCDAADRERSHHVTQRCLHYERLACRRAWVRHTAVEAVPRWLHPYLGIRPAHTPLE